MSIADTDTHHLNEQHLLKKVKESNERTSLLLEESRAELADLEARLERVNRLRERNTLSHVVRSLSRSVRTRS